ncbi:hypothetical protein JOD54_000510 [Actinokineospora baliensis]|nr:hypothetical protein [Actinokineospora baliensis]MBM7770305.1 hypothetical protein [Actinokineospora baliensis]MBM7770306.1 hypothetical protein [Actinokineospora baliensis]
MSPGGTPYNHSAVPRENRTHPFAAGRTRMMPSRGTRVLPAARSSLGGQT